MRIRICYLLLYLLISASFFSCKKKIEADAIFFNAKIYTVDYGNSMADALVVKDGKIIYAGHAAVAFEFYNVKDTINLEGKFVYPGLIDAHCHFLEYGKTLKQVNLTGTYSWASVIEKVKSFDSVNHDGWLVGRGWDQNDWVKKDFPTNAELNLLFPDRPVFLERIDGHASVANAKALELAGFNAATNIDGGILISENGKLTGVLIDNAKDSLRKIIPEATSKQISNALMKAQKNCFEVGLTTVDEAGLTKREILIIDSLQKSNDLKIRIYAMVTDDEESKKYFFENGKYKTDRLNVRAIKYYADGALGSRGALLLKPYTDDSKNSGLSIHPRSYYEEQAALCKQYDFQMCTHAIGDSANRMMLQVYGKILGGSNDLRWRIEHCQVVAPDDFELFQKFNIIPSVQTTHATSDMYWVLERLGIFRIKGAYAYHNLMLQNNWIANGSDFPVEDINPLYGFYAAVARKDQKGFPADGFQMENALNREEALNAMTLWAAQSNFEENEKGSLSAGKFADFVVLEKDIMT
ncbi:MAG: amidohydrolase, partial [Chitinophagales bacterium]|nr:amidohydrolase [Chitinophagales bacterium]